MISKKDQNLFAKMSMFKGKFVERLVFEQFNRVAEVHQNVKINNLETDLVVVDKNVVILVEVKAIKYDSDMKERTKSEQKCFKDLRKGINQLHDRLISIQNMNKIYSLETNMLVYEPNVSTFSIPLMITLDYLYDLSELNHHEASVLGLKINPVILNMDDFIAIMERIRSIDEFQDYLLMRYELKSKNYFYKDNFFLFMGYKNFLKSEHNENINPITTRNQVFMQNYFDRYK